METPAQTAPQLNDEVDGPANTLATTRHPLSRARGKRVEAEDAARLRWTGLSSSQIGVPKVANECTLS